MCELFLSYSLYQTQQGNVNGKVTLVLHCYKRLTGLTTFTCSSAALSFCPCVRLSVHPSVTLWYIK